MNGTRVDSTKTPLVWAVLVLWATQPLQAPVRLLDPAPGGLCSFKSWSYELRLGVDLVFLGDAPIQEEPT